MTPNDELAFPWAPAKWAAKRAEITDQVRRTGQAACPACRTGLVTRIIRRGTAEIACANCREVYAFEPTFIPLTAVLHHGKKMNKENR